MTCGLLQFEAIDILNAENFRLFLEKKIFFGETCVPPLSAGHGYLWVFERRIEIFGLQLPIRPHLYQPAILHI
jgi:hypothetical protein